MLQVYTYIPLVQLQCTHMPPHITHIRHHIDRWHADPLGQGAHEGHGHAQNIRGVLLLLL